VNAPAVCFIDYITREEGKEKATYLVAFVAIGCRFMQSLARLSHQLKNHLAAILQRQMAVFR